VPAFASVVRLCVFLKYRSIIQAEPGPLFAQLLIQVALPVVIFSKLATQPIAPRQLLLVVSMIVAVIVCLGVSWGAYTINFNLFNYYYNNSLLFFLTSS
jgi:predicted permease